jgi:hypothetical protein
MGTLLAALQTPEGKERLVALLPFAVGGLLAAALVLAGYVRSLRARYVLAVAGAGALLALGIYREEFGEVMFNAAML